MGKYYFGITDKSNWLVIKRKHVYGVTKTHTKRYNAINEGDNIVFYITKVKRIGGYIFKIIKKYKSKKELFYSGAGYHLRLKLNPLSVTQDKKINSKIIKNLDFIRNKNKWGTSFMGKALIEISKKDFETIKHLLND